MKRIIKYIIAAALILLLLISVSAVTRSPFADVPSGAWYSDAVQWAYECGITNGTSANTFEPDRPITRAEMVTMLWRLSGNAPEETDTPEPTRDIPKPPYVEPTIHPEYADCYVGRMHIGSDYSVGLYETLDQALVDMSDTAFIYKVWGDQTYMVGDHDYEGLWIIRYLVIGDTMCIEYADGTVETYVMQYADPHVRNTGYDVLDADGRSCFHKGYDLFIATCNDSTGKDMTATFWDLVEQGETE